MLPFLQFGNSFPSLFTCALVAIFLLFVLVLRSQSSRFRYPRPPGPRGQWFVGNARQIPEERPWLWYHQLYKEYGSS